MREAHPRERTVGIEWYASDADGVGGRLRDRPEDFRVHELEAFATEPADSEAGDYPYLVLRVTLTGWDTNGFASRLSDAMSISRERVDWAGTKDKHAVTTQLFSVYDVDPEDLPEVRDADIEVVGRAGRHLSYGDLAGNAFEITVRDSEHPENADAITEQLREFAGGHGGDRAGVPNVFGHQRFGSRRPVTHEVGLHIVRRKWREAVLAYAGNPYDTEPEETQAARELVDEQAASDDPDWDVCLDEMPGQLGYERSMLHRLREREAGQGDTNSGGEQVTDVPESPRDSGASQTQSDDDPWRYALEAVPSNLQRLFVNAAQSYAFNRILSNRLERGLPFDKPVEGDVCCFTDNTVDAVRKPDPDRIQRATESRVDILTRHCERGRAFVTAPLIGTETEFADGEPGEIEREVFADLGLEQSMFSLPGEFDSSGTRRAVLVDSELAVTQDPLTFEFVLPSGSYATAMLREYLKTDPESL